VPLTKGAGRSDSWVTGRIAPTHVAAGSFWDVGGQHTQFPAQ